MAVPERLVALEGAFNFRDLGGYPSADGRVTQWGRLFRSDTLHELTEGDVEVLRGLGLTTVVDLRTPKELARTGRGRLGPEPIGFHHLSVIGDGDAVGPLSLGVRTTEPARFRPAPRKTVTSRPADPCRARPSPLLPPPVKTSPSAIAGTSMSAGSRWSRLWTSSATRPAAARLPLRGG